METLKRKISAEIIADSKNEFGQRITTFLLVFPRMVLAEFNTHRALTRNSASSRAIPFKKMLRMVMTDPFIPIAWMKDHSGMQGNEYFTGWKVSLLKQLWLTARNFAVIFAWLLSKLGLTKQIVNRLIEPFMWHTIVTTGTEWENFFALRAEGSAEIHIQKLAFLMLGEMNTSTPKQLKAGEWHIPFGDRFEEYRGEEGMDGLFGVIKMSEPASRYSQPEDYALRVPEYKVKIATARLARLSYMTFEGKDDYFADVKLHDRLLASGHLSPFEHCARAMSSKEYYENLNGGAQYIEAENYHIPFSDAFGWSGNFRGFIQYRKMYNDENRKEPRLLEK